MISRILPQSVFNMEVNNPTIDEQADDDSSIADSVDLLMERQPQLFHPMQLDDKDEDDEEEEIDATYVSKTEFELPLRNQATTSIKTTAPRRKMRTRRLPDGTFGRVPVESNTVTSAPPKVVLVSRAA